MNELRAEAEKIVRRLREGGHEAVFAGGCVRDLLRGVSPHDYDIATSARPSEVERIFPHSLSVGAHFGVMIVKSGSGAFEVATFREDGLYLDGRRPEDVRFSDAQRDAQRRDFTINGLFYDPIEDRVIDYVGGQRDLEGRVLRAIGDAKARFSEDHLRLMRAVRFAAVLDFTIEGATWAALSEAAPSIRHIAEERVRQELVKTLEHPRRVSGFDLLCESGLMEHILPEIIALKGCEQPPQFHPEGDVFVHTRLMLSKLPPEAPIALVLAALLHDIGKPATRCWDPLAQRFRFNEHDKVGARMTEAILRRLRFPNLITDAVVEMVGQHMAFMNVQQMRTSKLRRFMARDTFAHELELHRVDCLGSHGQLDNYEFLEAKLEEFAREPLIPPRLVTGHDLMEVGIPPGPQLGGLLKEIESRQLEGTLRTKDEALAWVRGQREQSAI
ncbi:MAG: CCA tRNA nucleotidyltransferase [Verrucomicrobiales bacterium]